MALSRALKCFIRQKNLFYHNKPMISSKAIICFPFSTSETIHSSKHSLSKSEKNQADNKLQVDFIEVVKDKTSLAWQTTIFMVGLTGAGIIFYYVFQELFSGNSPNSIYSKAFKKVKNDPRIIDIFGTHIKAYGEESSRGRRGHVRHMKYVKDGIEHLKMKFHIQGLDKKATVHLEVKKNTDGNWDYRYLFVQLKNRPKSVFVIEDNRDVENVVYNHSKDTEELMPYMNLPK